jgi:O-antigen ligase
MILMFGFFWIPMVASLPDAVNFQRSLATTLVFLRFPLAAVFALYALNVEEARQRLIMVLGLVLTFNTLDIVVQAAVGYDLFGREWAGSGSRMTGLIHDKLVVGHIMAVLSPVYFYWVREIAKKRAWLWLLAFLYAAAVLLTGARAAWLMLGVGGGLFAMQMFIIERVRWTWRVAGGFTLLAAITVVGLMQSPAWRGKLETTAGLVSGNYAKANAATSLRLPIWGVAVRMTEDHWINGVGPRGFRYLYEQYAEKDDPILVNGKNTRATHPHQFVLEIAAETGVIGLLGYLLALGYWIRRGAIACRTRIVQALPWISAVFIAIMPLNAHMAFYASFWSCITWWLLAVSLAYCRVDERAAHG